MRDCGKSRIVVHDVKFSDYIIKSCFKQHVLPATKSKLMPQKFLDVKAQDIRTYVVKVKIITISVLDDGQSNLVTFVWIEHNKMKINFLHYFSVILDYI